jgi:hypothetical protein
MDENLSFADKAGCMAIVVADMLVTFNAAEFNDNGLRQAVAMAEQHVAAHISYFRTETMNHARRVKESATDILDKWLSEPSTKRGSMSIELLSGTSDSSVGPYAFRLSVPTNNPEYEAGYIQLSLPRSVAISEFNLLRQIASDISLLIPTTWGRAGFAVEYDMLRSNSVRDKEIVKWCTRFECIDLRHLIPLAEKALGCIPSVGWLNILTIDRMKSLRSSAALGARPNDVRLGPNLVGIVADERPILGDRNRGEDVSGYREIYSMLRELLCESPPIMRVMKQEQMLWWSRRFERSGK